MSARSLPHSLSRHSLWLLPLLPLLCGLVAWRWSGPGPENARVMPQTAGSLLDGAHREAAQRPAPPRKDVAAALAEAQAGSASSVPELLPASMEELKELMLTLAERSRELEKELMDASEDPRRGISEEWGTVGTGIERVLAEMAARDAAGSYAWLQEAAPRWACRLMDRWAEKDPAAALAAVLECRSLDPCRMDTLPSLIGHLSAQGDPEALRVAMERMPWHLFPGMGSYQPRVQKEGPVLPGMWIDTGIARSLAEQGVQLSGVFGGWAAERPAEALAAWQDWPARSQMNRDQLLEEMISAPGLPDAAAAVNARTATALRETLQRMARQRPWLGKPISGVAGRLPQAQPEPGGP